MVLLAVRLKSAGTIPWTRQAHPPHDPHLEAPVPLTLEVLSQVALDLGTLTKRIACLHRGSGGCSWMSLSVASWVAKGGQWTSACQLA